MNKNNIFESRRPLIAILRGITPLEAESVSDVLIEALPQLEHLKLSLIHI